MYGSYYYQHYGYGYGKAEGADSKKEQSPN